MRLETAERMARVRRLVRERAEIVVGALVAKQSAELERSRRCRAEAGEILGAAGRGGQIVDAGRLRADAELAEGLRALAARSDARARELAAEADAARAVLVEARKAERTAERLVERIRGRAAEAARRREQGILDEVGARRRPDFASSEGAGEGAP